MLKHCESALQMALPDEVLYIDGIPLTTTGKMDKKVVRADLDAKGYELPDLRKA